MNDIEPGNRYTPTNVLAKQGVTAVGCLIGGAGLLIAGVLPPVIGIIAGVVIGIVGIGAAMSKDPDDRRPGILAALAGGLTILSKIGIVRPLAGTLLTIGAVGLLAMGIWKGVKFIIGLKNRT
ncbi:MAG: hypothetical protein LBB98_14780 [Treponema sp.]|jgi:4-amino-4-deoxy-L-arabinose transferase-like glycosyltransferase|nr:hypothetical protein [Treponema sp.]